MLAIEIPGVTIEALIGKGAHAAVYRVRRDGRSYALKVPKQLRATDEATQQNFLREAAALALTRHESLPDIHEVGVLKGMLLPDLGVCPRCKFADTDRPNGAHRS